MTKQSSMTLIERLRILSEPSSGQIYDEGTMNLLHEAAEALTAARAELAEKEERIKVLENFIAKRMVDVAIDRETEGLFRELWNLLVTTGDDWAEEGSEAYKIFEKCRAMQAEPPAQPKEG